MIASVCLGNVQQTFDPRAAHRLGHNLLVRIVDELREELKQIPSGRGVRRAHCHTWIGPELQRILRLDESLSDHVWRERLIDLLMKETARLPEQLRLLYRIASGIDSDGRFLNERLAAAERTFERESKTLTRRVREAESLMASGIAARNPRVIGPYGDQGWHWEVYSADLDLAPRHPTVTLDRQIRALDDGQEIIREIFAVPQTAVGRTLGITALSGCTVASVTQPSNSTWQASFQLDSPLRRGFVTRTKVRVTFENLECIRPYLVMAPLRPCSRYQVTVRMGSPAAASLIWKIDGLTTTSLDEQIPPPDAEAARAGSVHGATFHYLMNGLAYGLAWQWATPIA